MDSPSVRADARPNLRGYGEAVTQQTLTLPLLGSNPSAPSNSVKVDCMKHARRYQTERPYIYFEYGWWKVSQQLRERGLDGVIVSGEGRKIKSAWNDFARNYNWYKKGCPGMPLGKKKAMQEHADRRVSRRQQREAEERNAISRAIQGP